MIRKFFFVILLVVFPSLAQADIRGQENITVLASSSMTNPITEIAVEYSRQKNRRINF
jgi:ABC-type molybdate transport system substrate-binding protein